jgi:capsular exopolysaccharide synthesis family protein
MAMGRQRQTKVIAIVGATLGEGKTATTANLASALAHADNRVVVVSADLRKPRLHEFFQLENDVGLSDLLLGRARASDVVQQHDANLFVIPGGTIPDRPAELLESEAMGNVVEALRGQFDFVLIDTPPVLGLADTLAIAPLVDAILLVAQAETSRRSAVVQAQDQLEQVGASIRGCLLTNVTIGRSSVYRYGYGTSPSRREHRGSGTIGSSFSRAGRWIATGSGRAEPAESTGPAEPAPAPTGESTAETTWSAEQIVPEQRDPGNGEPVADDGSANGSRAAPGAAGPAPEARDRSSAPRRPPRRRPPRRSR